MLDTRRRITRETYSLLDFFGDIGGLYECLYLFSYVVVYFLTKLRFPSLIANQMYLWKEPNNFMSEFSCFGSKNLVKSWFFSGDVPIRYPTCLELYFLVCCWKPKWWKQYKEALKKIDYDVNCNLNITRLLKRLRLHGLALDFALSVRQKTEIAKLIQTKPMRYICTEEPKD